MSSKKKKSKQTDGEEQIPAEMNADPAQNEAAATDASVSDSAEFSADDLLEDVRRSLIEEEETAETQKQSKWWRRIGRGASKQDQKDESPKPVEEIDLPTPIETSSDSTLDELKGELEAQEYLDEIDDLIDLLDHDTVETKEPAPVQQEQEAPAEPEKPVDLAEWKKQVFQPRTDTAASESHSEVRSIALDGEEDVFVEVESRPQDPLEERLKAVENAFKPYRRYINFAIAFLGVVIAGVALSIIYNVYQQSRPEPVREPDSSLPFPTSVSLPGGWSFPLGQGSLTDGSWEPRGAEWLQGTEVCRWVSLPWSRQLEAVIRTLNEDDPIELTMSNNDKLVYRVSSIRQMSPEELQELDSNTPCLLIMLTEDSAEKRWILTGQP